MTEYRCLDCGKTWFEFDGSHEMEFSYCEECIRKNNKIDEERVTGFVYDNCPYCGSDKIEDLGDGRGRCMECDTIFVIKL